MLNHLSIRSAHFSLLMHILPALSRSEIRFANKRQEEMSAAAAACALCKYAGAVREKREVRRRQGWGRK
jgi:hypothetical protein